MATPPKKPTDGTKPPAPRKPAKPRVPSTRKPAATPAKPAVRKPAAKPAATPSRPASTGKPAAKRATPAGKVTAAGASRKWGIAAVIGGVGAAVTAGLLALRGSTPTVTTTSDDQKAHQADGTDSSSSFNAGIADEGTIPE